MQPCADNYAHTKIPIQNAGYLNLMHMLAEVQLYYNKSTIYYDYNNYFDGIPCRLGSACVILLLFDSYRLAEERSEEKTPSRLWNLLLLLWMMEFRHSDEIKFSANTYKIDRWDISSEFGLECGRCGKNWSSSSRRAARCSDKHSDTECIIFTIARNKQKFVWQLK